jgi:hypothetical protein
MKASMLFFGSSHRIVYGVCAQSDVTYGVRRSELSNLKRQG